MGQRIQTLQLLHHLETYTGEHRGTESQPHNRPHCQYSLERFDHTAASLTTITSNGLRFLDNDAPFGEEIACTLRTSQAGYTRAIIGAMCEYVTQNRTGIEYTQIFDNDTELFDGTGKQGLLAATHPYFATGFNYLTQGPTATLTREVVNLQIVTLIPITRQEIELAARDTDLLYDHWDETNPDLLDIVRPTTI
ncbi:suppressor of fused domain protein [Kibdelosporangium persicum]|uniref:Suppressor of fused protein (SUFU) n=1 Tax=Kibdelosporangium persicum TaxID=2698649 RepID=A0ABX2F9G8_9PSEU|nr:suppressor of fused domain protein [Kibdelosporangium persicum]NRN67999.1 Suppressor of fused protein (SUFU) [Kibdelosporangium persicum]